MPMRDLYEILGVSHQASVEEIKAARKKLSRELHPDVTGGNKPAEDRLKEINAAYSILKDPEKRREYDRLGEAGARPNATERQTPQQPRDINEWMDQIFRQSFGISWEEMKGGSPSPKKDEGHKVGRKHPSVETTGKTATRTFEEYEQFQKGFEQASKRSPFSQDQSLKEQGVEHFSDLAPKMKPMNPGRPKPGGENKG